MKISYYGVGDFLELISLSEEHGNSKFNTSQSLNTTYSKIQLSGIVGRNYYNLQVLTEKSGDPLGGGGLEGTLFSSFPMLRTFKVHICYPSEF